MTPDHLATVLELALYRVGDRLVGDTNQDTKTGQALREVANEIHKLMHEHREAINK